MSIDLYISDLLIELVSSKSRDLDGSEETYDYAFSKCVDDSIKFVIDMLKSIDGPRYTEESLLTDFKKRV